MLASTECREPAEWCHCSSVNTNSCAWCMTGDYIPFRGWAGCSSWSTARRLIRFHLVWRAALSACTRGTPWNTGDNCTFHSGSNLFTYLFYFCIAATTATTSRLLDSIGPLSKSVARLKIKRRQLPLPSLPFSLLPVLSFAIPSPSLPFPLPLYQLRSLGKRCELPQWCMGWNPSRWTIWCIFERKRMALLTTLLWILNQNIFSFLEWVSINAVERFLLLLLYRLLSII